MKELGYKSPSPVQWHINKYKKTLKLIDKYISGLTTLEYNDHEELVEKINGTYLLKSEVIEMMKKILLTPDKSLEEKV